MKGYPVLRAQGLPLKARLFRAAAVALAAALCLASCKGRGGEAAEAELEMVAMGTVVSIKAYAPSAAAAREAASLAEAEIKRLEKLWSATDPESEISAVNAGGPVAATVSAETAALLLFAKEMAEKTGGAFDPTVYPLVSAWGFLDHQYRIPTDGEIAAILSRVGSEKMLLEGSSVTLLDGAQVDLGGIAKGAAADAVARTLRENGAASAIINLGGNVHLVGARPDGSPWRIGIRDPYGNGILGIVAAQDRAIVTSGAYERNFEGEDGRVYHHIMDSETGKPAEGGLVSATIVAGEGRLADALSTALFVMGAERAADFWRGHGGFETILVTQENEVLVSEGIAPFFVPQPEYAAAARVITKDSARSPLLSEFIAAE